MMNSEITKINNNENKNENTDENTDKNIKEKKKKRKKNLCDNIEADCKQKQSQSVGYCKWCEKTFCSAHRLPESHNCIGLKKCKTQAFNINKNKINNEKCIGQKVISV